MRVIFILKRLKDLEPNSIKLTPFFVYADAEMGSFVKGIVNCVTSTAGQDYKKQCIFFNNSNFL